MTGRCALWPCLLLAALGSAQANDTVWTVRGDTTLRTDRYQDRGNTRLSPYRQTGTHSYQDFNLQLSGRPHDRQYWEFNLSGVVSDSDYRSRDDGFVPEWLHLRHENGTAALPFRLDLGDQRALFSRLTLDRTMQAVRLELQPVPSPQRRQSLVLVSGRDRRHWRQQQGSDATYSGASWLIDDKRLGRYSVNVVQSRPADMTPPPLAGASEDPQWVASVAAAWQLDVYRQQLAAEAEWAWQQESPDGGSDQSDQGLRVHLRGKSADQAAGLPVDYELRYEDYSEGFEPAGVNQHLADSRRMSAAGGLRLGSVMELRGRYERNVDNASRRAMTVDDWSVRLLSPATFGWVSWLGHEWALRFRDRGDAVGVTDTSSVDVNWNLRVSGSQSSSTQLRLRWFEQEDHASGFHAIEERQVVLNHARRFRLGGLALTATPGVDFRHRTGLGEVTLLSPTLNLNLNGRSHHLGMRLGYRDFDRPGDEADLEEYSFKLDYRYQANAHTLGLEYDQLLRVPGNGEQLEAWRAGVFWRYNFKQTF